MSAHLYDSGMLLQEMDEETAERCLAEAAESPFARTEVEYPPWYLRRWHFLPEGYLSRRSAAMYEWGIRNIYYAGAEGRALRALRSALRLQHPERVVELGCGPGHAVEAIGDLLPWSEVVGVDLSPFQIERAMRRCARFGARVRLLHADALALPLTDSAYDAIVSGHLVGHLPAAAASSVMAEAERVLMPQGKLYLIEHSWHPLPSTGLRLRWTQRLTRVFGRLLCYEKG
jgi:ubiquinone/menaquinone biosynthesis C-methylase UbiE